MSTKVGSLVTEVVVDGWGVTRYYPSCALHGSMLKVSKDGLWRCPECHIGYDEKTNAKLGKIIQP